MKKFFAAIGRYVLLMGKVFSRPEKAGIYYRRILVEIDALGINLDLYDLGRDNGDINGYGLTREVDVYLFARLTL